MTEDRRYIVHRRVPRRNFERKVGILVKGTYEVNMAHEIGERGILVTTTLPLKKDGLIVITFNIPGLLNTVVRGIVIYSMEDALDPTFKKYWVEFQSIDFQSKRQIRKYVAARNDNESLIDAK
jgi:hypothetical protein